MSYAGLARKLPRPSVVGGRQLARNWRERITGQGLATSLTPDERPLGVSDLHERIDFQLPCELGEVLHERARQRNAGRASRFALGMTLFAGQPDSIDARQPFRRA